jgi:hypothetical protein
VFPPNLLLISERLFHQHGNRNFAKLFRNMLQMSDVRHRMVMLPGQQQLRDVLPVQVAGGRFVLFQSGGISERRRFFSAQRQTSIAEEFLRIFPDADIVLSQLRLEGTQISLNADTALVSDKVLWDNRNYKSLQIIEDLEQLLERRVLIVPSLHSDDSGSLAGFMRIAPNGTVLIQDSPLLEKGFRRRLESQFRRQHLLTNLLPNPYPQSSKKHPSGYLGYLELGQSVYYPIFGNNEADVKAVETMALLYPDAGCVLLNPKPFGGYNGWVFLQTWSAEVDQQASRASDEAYGKPARAALG